MSRSKRIPAVRRMFRPVLLTAALGFGVKAVLLHPLYIQLASNISYQNAWYTNILYYLIDGGLIDLAIFAVCYTASAYAVWQGGVKASRGVIAAFSIVTACKFPLNYLMSALTDTGFPSGGELLRDLPPLLLLLALELLQYGLVIAVMALAKRRYDARVELASAQAELTDTKAPAPVFPFVRLVSFKNPLQLTALSAAFILFLSREVGYHIYQITLLRFFGSTDGWADMLFTLILDLVIGVLFYFASILLFLRFHKGESDSE